MQRDLMPTFSGTHASRTAGTAIRNRHLRIGVAMSTLGAQLRRGATIFTAGGWFGPQRPDCGRRTDVWGAESLADLYGVRESRSRSLAR
jgi:hypothetical protein